MGSVNMQMEVWLAHWVPITPGLPWENRAGPGTCKEIWQGGRTGEVILGGKRGRGREIQVREGLPKRGGN